MKTLSNASISNLVVGIKGAGEMGSAVAVRLYMANIKKIIMMEISNPLAVRRRVSFCEAVHEGIQSVEGVQAVKVKGLKDIRGAWDTGKIAVIVDPEWALIQKIAPDVIVDAILAKKNLGTSQDEAPLVIGLGPGFTAQQDVNMVVETNRGHNLGRIITSGSADPNTGVPGSIHGYSSERVLKAPADGIFSAKRAIGDIVKEGEIIGTVSLADVLSKIDGVIRGLIRSNIEVSLGLKLCDIDPRGEVSYCSTISDKARAIAGSVLEAVLRAYNKVP